VVGELALAVAFCFVVMGPSPLIMASRRHLPSNILELMQKLLSFLCSRVIVTLDPSYLVVNTMECGGQFHTLVASDGGTSVCFLSIPSGV
jgi:hypothetical protein